MTGEVLKSILEYIDSLEIMERAEDTTPCIQIDGHQSRFDVTFLEYIVDKNMQGQEWSVLLGCPYGTSYWQVADSSKQNGSLKMATTKEKRKLIQLKKKHGLPVVINKMDIIPLLSMSYPVSVDR